MQEWSLYMTARVANSPFVWVLSMRAQSSNEFIGGGVGEVSSFPLVFDGHECVLGGDISPPP